MHSVHKKISFTKRIQTLLNYSLVETQLNSSACSMHPVVHKWCFHTMTENKDEVVPLTIMGVENRTRVLAVRITITAAF